MDVFVLGEDTCYLPASPLIGVYIFKEAIIIFLYVGGMKWLLASIVKERLNLLFMIPKKRYGVYAVQNVLRKIQI
jgi:hypothetical protein